MGSISRVISLFVVENNRSLVDGTRMWNEEVCKELLDLKGLQSGAFPVSNSIRKPSEALVFRPSESEVSRKIAASAKHHSSQWKRKTYSFLLKNTTTHKTLERATI